MNAATPLNRMVGHFDKSQLPAPLKVDNYMWGWQKKMLKAETRITATLSERLKKGNYKNE